ncbi:MAG: hypothetical protein IKV67_10200, partial [Paludibacteraceae bacterium]|nr:hypothetical protein [Paludibacteraceae bacterium]
MRPGLLTSLAMMCLSLPFTLSALERDKDGYCLIHNAEELAQYRDSCKSNSILNGRLAADIDLNKVCGIINGDTINWEPINSPESSFDGANHTISNFYYNSPNSSNVGFFSEINQVDNLILKNAFVKGDNDVTGIAKAKKINNCHFEGIVEGGDNISIMTCDTLTNSSNYGCCLGKKNAYGMIAKKYVENCYNRGAIYGTKYVAAFEGSYNGNQSNLYNVGKTFSHIGEYGLLDDYNKNNLSYCYVLDTFSTYSDKQKIEQKYYDKSFYILPLTKFEDGSVTDSLNKYVKEHPTTNNNVQLLSWVQGKDGYPRFENVDLQPTEIHVVDFYGAYEGFEKIENGTITLPKSTDPMYEYDFEGFDGTWLDNDTIVDVYYSFNTTLEKDTDGFYLIKDAQDLVSYREFVNKDLPMDGRLAADIDLSTVCGKDKGSWAPIHANKQIFDGAGHTISNLYISIYGDYRPFGVALFAEIDVVKNLTLKNAYVKMSDYYSTTAAAGIAAYCALMYNCHFEGIVIGQDEASALTSNCYKIVNCSNYGFCMTESSYYSDCDCDKNASGWNANYVINCYNRGKIVSNGVSSVCNFGSSSISSANFYNAGILQDTISVLMRRENSTDRNSVENCFNLKRESDIYKDSIATNLSLSSFTSGAVTDSLNNYVSQNKYILNPFEDKDSRNIEDMPKIELLTWVQGEDGFPRFKDVDLKPTPAYIINFVGAYNAKVISFDGTVELPKPDIEGIDYVMENGFDGKNITSDSIVRVSAVTNKYFELTQDTDGFYLINNKADLCYFSNAVNNGATKLNARMTNDIDLEYELNGDNNWIPIGSYSNYFVHHEDDMVFKDTSSYEGIFDGTGHTISNLFGSTIPCYYKNAVLFLSIKNATIKNLVLKNSLLGSEKETAMIGHAENSTIVNCGTEADFVALTKTNIAAICASAWNCKIENCYNIGNITDNRREFPNYAFVRGVNGKEGNTTSVKNGYSIMSSNNTKKESPILFCSEDIANISHCFVDTVLSPAVIVKDPVVGTSTDYIKSEAFLKEMNQWVDSMNAAQSEIVYANWEKDPNDGYPKFKKGDLSKSSDVMQPQPNSLTIYSDGKDLFIQSTQKGHVTIYDVNGKSIESVIYDEGLTTVSGLSSGIYIAGGTKAIIK